MYDKTFDPKVVLGHCDLITWFSDFAFYLGFLLVYKHISFTLCLRMTRPLTLECDLMSCFSDFALYLDTQLVYFHTSLIL